MANTDFQFSDSMGERSPAISIIIPTRNRYPILMSSLSELTEAISGISAEVIVVNDGDSPLDLAQFRTAVKVVANRGSGVASARNTGASFAAGTVLLFMDDDMWMTRRAIEEILRFHNETDFAALNVNWIYPPDLDRMLPDTVFGRYLGYFGFTSLKGWSKNNIEWHDTERFETRGITSQNLSIRKQTFIKTGGYNEAFPLAGFEDYDYAKRLNERGVKIVVDPLILTFHNEADRLSLDDWLDRRVRGGITRRVAVAHGHPELQLYYSVGKKAALSCIRFSSPFLRRLISMPWLARRQRLDGIRFRLINLLLAEAIYRGYSGKYLRS